MFILRQVTSCADSGGRDVSGPGCCRQRLASAEQESHGSALMQAVDAQPGSQCEGAHTVSIGPRQPGEEPQLDLLLRRGVSHAAADVMSAVQVLRAKAKAAGNLKSGSQITVVQQSPQTIVIQPANPQVVYVPQYNPTVVYGTPVATPGYSTADVVATSMLAFGVGIAVGAAINNSCCGWGYSYWNCNWHGGTVVYHSTGYYGNSAWHGGYYGSSATAYGPYGAARVGLLITPPQGLMRVAHRPQPRMASSKLVKPTTQTRELMPRHIKPPTPMATTEARSSQRTATPRTPSIKRPRKGLWERYRLRRAAKVLPRRARTAMRCRRPDRKRQQVCGSKRECLQEHGERLEPNPERLVLVVR